MAPERALLLCALGGEIVAYTGNEVFAMAISILDELSDSGTIVDSQIKEYKYRAPYLLDLWQHEMVAHGDLYKTFELSCIRKKNLLGDVIQMGKIIENNGESQAYSGIGANCFYLEVDGDCALAFTENGAALSGKYSFNGGAETDFTGSFSIAVPAGTTSFLPIRGILSPASQTNTIAMTISGTYYFRHNNRALSPYKFSAADKVPDFKPWYKVDMPSDFKSKSQIISEYPSWQYQEGSPSVKWEGANELYVMFSYEGLIRIKYVPVPAKITTLTQTLEIDEITAASGAYYLAEHFALADQNSELAQRCKEKYRELKVDSMIKKPLQPSEIKDVYGVADIK
jgi:hypothetical protein